MIKSTSSITPDQLKTAADVLSRGKNGDTILARINPEEAMMLKQRGGAGQKDQYGITQFFPEDAEEQLASASTPEPDTSATSTPDVGENFAGTDTTAAPVTPLDQTDIFKSVMDFAKTPLTSTLDALKVNDLFGVKSVADLIPSGKDLAERVKKQNKILAGYSSSPDQLNPDGSAKDPAAPQTAETAQAKKDNKMGKAGDLIATISDLQSKASKLMEQVGNSKDFSNLLAAFSPQMAEDKLNKAVQDAVQGSR